MPRKKKLRRLAPRNPHAVKAAARRAGPMKDQRHRRRDQATQRELDLEVGSDDR